MGSMWAEVTLLEGPGAGKQPLLELARCSALAPRCPMLCPSPEVQDPPSDGRDPGSVLRRPRSEGETGHRLRSHMASHYFLHHPHHDLNF